MKLYRPLLVCLFFLYSFILTAQTAFVNHTFEGTDGWQTAGSTSPNSWMIGTCASNGLTQTGSNAAYISAGGTVPGCGPTGESRYGYVNAPAGSLSTIFYTEVNATCAAALQLEFETKIEGAAGTDFLEVVYSIDNGANWVVNGTQLQGITFWQPVSQALPALLNNTTFWIGFRFTYDDAGANNAPAAIDNVRILAGAFNDVNPPTLTCPGDYNIVVDASCGAVVPDFSQALLALSDDCSDSSAITILQSPAAGTSLPNSGGSSTMITLSATDAGNNSVSCFFQLFTNDVTAPSVNCPNDTVLQLNASCQATIGNFVPLVTASDNCTASGSLIVSQSPVSGTTLSGIGATQVVTITVEDESNNQVQCAFDISVVDTVMPVITCPANQAIYATASCNAVLADYTALATVTENCDPTYVINQLPVSGTIITDTTTITLTVSGSTPAGSDACSFTLNFVDTISPVAVCHGPISVYPGANCQAEIPDVEATVIRSDNCTAVNDLTLEQVPAPGSFITEDSLAVITVTDLAGNEGTCTVQFVLNDTVSPLLTCPIMDTVIADAGCDYTIADLSGTAVASDNCTPTNALVFSQLPIVGATLPRGEHTITLFVQDANGNSASCPVEVTVVEDITPVVNCPASVAVPMNALCIAHVPNLVPQASASDNCSATGQLSYSQTPAMSVSFSDTITAHIFVTDTDGNTGSCELELIPLDTVNPVVSCNADTAVAITNPCNYAIPDLSGSYGAADGCTSFEQLTFQQSPPAGTNASGVSDVTITITDLHGNATSCITQVFPIDATPATITCPGTQAINNGTSCDYTLTDYTGLAVVNDNCSPSVVSQNPAPGSLLHPGASVITLTVTDAGGNTTSCTFHIEITESVDPEIDCPANVSTCDPIVNYAAPIGSDNCIGFIISQSDVSGLTSGDLFPMGFTTQTYMVTDSSGNTASCSFTVEVLNYPDTARVLNDTIELCNLYSTIVTAEVPSNGTGQWTAIGGTATFLNPNGASTTVSNLSIGTNLLEWSVSTPECGSKRDTMVVIVYQLPSHANVPASLIACNPDETVIQTLPATIGSGSWSGPPGVTFDDPEAAVTTVSNLPAGESYLVWTVTNGTCPASSDTMTVYMLPYAEIDQPDTSLCLSDLPWAVTGTIPESSQSVVWNIIEGDGTFANKYDETTALTGASAGNLVIVYTMNYPGCGSSTDTLELVITQCASDEIHIPTLFTPNADGDNDVFELPNFTLLYPQCEVQIYNRWGSIVYESVGYQTPWDGNFKEEPVPPGTYFYRIALNDGSDEVLTGSISIIR